MSFFSQYCSFPTNSHFGYTLNRVPNKIFKINPGKQARISDKFEEGIEVLPLVRVEVMMKFGLVFIKK